jgi:hypothetical protein
MKKFINGKLYFNIFYIKSSDLEMLFVVVIIYKLRVRKRNTEQIQMIYSVLLRDEKQAVILIIYSASDKILLLII